MKKSQEDLKKRSKRNVSLTASEDYVDMSLKKVSCDKSLAAVLLLAKESLEDENHYEPIYISADFNLAVSKSDRESSIYEYCEF